MILCDCAQSFGQPLTVTESGLMVCYAHVFERASERFTMLVERSDEWAARKSRPEPTSFKECLATWDSKNEFASLSVLFVIITFYLTMFGMDWATVYFRDGPEVYTMVPDWHSSEAGQRYLLCVTHHTVRAATNHAASLFWRESAAVSSKDSLTGPISPRLPYSIKVTGIVSGLINLFASVSTPFTRVSSPPSAIPATESSSQKSKTSGDAAMKCDVLCPLLVDIVGGLVTLVVEHRKDGIVSDMLDLTDSGSYRDISSAIKAAEKIRKKEEAKKRETTKSEVVASAAPVAFFTEAAGENVQASDSSNDDAKKASKKMTSAAQRDAFRAVGNLIGLKLGSNDEDAKEEQAPTEMRPPVLLETICRLHEANSRSAFSCSKDGALQREVCRLIGVLFGGDERMANDRCMLVEIQRNKVFYQIVLLFLNGMCGLRFLFVLFFQHYLKVVEFLASQLVVSTSVSKMDCEVSAMATYALARVSSTASKSAGRTGGEKPSAAVRNAANQLLEIVRLVLVQRAQERLSHLPKEKAAPTIERLDDDDENVRSLVMACFWGESLILFILPHLFCYILLSPPLLVLASFFFGFIPPTNSL
jgi:hypothetical protein